MSTEYYCDTCQIQCTGKAPYEQHLQSAKHIKKIKLNESEKPSKQSNLLNTSSVCSTEDKSISLTKTIDDSIYERATFSGKPFTISPETMRILLEWNHPLGYKPYCEICQLPLHGENNVDTHFKSNNVIHSEKLAVWKQICEGDGKYSCKVCLVLFSNEFLMREHFDSNQHASTVEQKLNLEKFIKIYETYSKLKQVRKERKNQQVNSPVEDSLENCFKELKIIDTTKPTVQHSINFNMLQTAMQKTYNDDD